jgi:signal transduction histidine kinase
MVEQYLPWLLSAITIYMTVLAGDKHRLAWAVGLLNQGLWLVWIFAAEAYGLIPMNIALWIVYARNHLKWYRGNS